MTKAPNTRQAFLEALLRLPAGGTLVNMTTLALGWGIHPSLLTRYLNELRKAGIIRTSKTLGQGLFVEITDRPRLAAMAKGSQEAAAG